MARKTNTKGFSLPVVLAVVAIIVALLLGGYFVWQRNKDDKTTNTKKSNTTSQSKQQEDKEDTATTDPSEGGKYLVIKEWGMRIPLSPSLQGDAEYGIFTYNDGKQAAYFASKKIAAKSTVPDCGLVTTTDDYGHGVSGGAIAVTRSTQEPDEEERELGFSRGSYWYTLGFSNGGTCYEGDTGGETGAFKTAMDEAIHKIEPVEQ